MLDARAYLSITLDPIRLAVLGHAAIGPVKLRELSERLEEQPRRVAEAIGSLRAVGLLTEDLRLDRDQLRTLATSLPREAAPDPEIVSKTLWNPQERDILNRFISGDRLREIPANRRKRRVVLERLAIEFEPGIRYEETEVNFVLQLWNPDYTALRRYLVDEGFMTRASGVYWRTGGRYEPGDASTAAADWAVDADAVRES
jgi:hypothetical protein